MKVFINSNPFVNSSRTVASCFVSWDFKATSPEEEKVANEKGYIRQSARLVAFGDLVGELEQFDKGVQVDIIADFVGERLYKKNNTVVRLNELIFKGYANAPAQTQTAKKPTVVTGKDEIPF